MAPIMNIASATECPRPRGQQYAITASATKHTEASRTWDIAAREDAGTPAKPREEFGVRRIPALVSSFSFSASSSASHAKHEKRQR
jgi:hypothetical protein